MKRNAIHLAGMFIFSLTVAATDFDCSEEASKICMGNISKGFNYLKSYPVSFPSEKGYQEFSYVFTKGTIYLIKLCQANGKPVEQNIFDNSRAKVGTNKISGSTIEAISYTCSATGIYYIRLYGDTQYCGNCLLAFSRPL